MTFHTRNAVIARHEDDELNRYLDQAEEILDTKCAECGGEKSWDEGLCPECLEAFRQLDEEGNHERPI